MIHLIALPICRSRMILYITTEGARALALTVIMNCLATVKDIGKSISKDSLNFYHSSAEGLRSLWHGPCVFPFCGIDYCSVIPDVTLLTL
jgi:hypothetical protein